MCSTILFAAALSCLGSDDYDARERGSRTLAVLVRDDPAAFGPHVARHASLHPSAEVRSRCGRLTAPFHAFLADTYVCPAIAWPCCDWAVDSGAFPDPDWNSWMCLVPQETGSQTCSPGWSRYRSASSLYVRAQIRCGYWSHTDADDAVRKAWESELIRFMNHYPSQVAAVEAWARR